MPLTTPIKRFSTINSKEVKAVLDALSYPLSGYLAGEKLGGFWVQSLEEEWAGRMGVKHAIACNSATSGLLAAATVCAPEWEDEDIAVPCFTMSATAAAPVLATKCWPYFMDCDPETYCSTPAHCPKLRTGLIVVTNLFGQAAPLTEWRNLANRLGVCLIEDAAQSPFATTPDGDFAGTVGDVGVFSLNVHKHLQVGEGGIMVTNNDHIASDLRDYINHGENAGNMQLGLNLRMTEMCAAMALCQLDKAEDIIAGRIELAHELNDMVKDFWTPPTEKGRHVFYHWAVRVPNRDRVCSFLDSENVPIRKGYVNPLHRIAAFREAASPCPIAEKAHDTDLMLFEICSWDPTKEQLREMHEIFKRASEFSNMHECPGSLRSETSNESISS